MPLRVFFLSTGRCGTQWLATAFNTLYEQSEVHAAHEPIGPWYKCREAFQEGRPLNPAVINHFINISMIPATYIETGWPCYVAAEYAVDCWGKDTRFIHLVRDKEDTVSSLMKHGYYSNKDDGFSQYCILGCPHIERPQREKVEWYYDTLNRYFERLTTKYDNLSEVVTYDQIFNGDGFRHICEHIGLRPRDISDIRKVKVDRYAPI